MDFESHRQEVRGAVKQLYDWQRRDADRLISAGSGLVCIEPGGGKTALGVSVLAGLDADQALIIAPKTTHRTAWVPEAREFCGREVTVIDSPVVRREFENGAPGWFVATPQLFTQHGSKWSPDAVVVDEAHQLGAPGGKGQKLLTSGRNPMSRRVPYRFALSGTPARNNFERMWSLARFLWPELAGPGEVADRDRYRWCHHRMTTVFNPHSGMGVDFVEEREPGRFLAECPTVVAHFQRTRCCDAHPTGFLDVPEPVTVHVEYGLTDQQRKSVEDLESKAFTWLREKPLATEIPLTTQLRIRQMLLAEMDVEQDGEVERVFIPKDAASPLADMMVDMARRTDDPIVVFTSSQQFARYVTGRFNDAGVPAFEYSGKTSKTRDQFLELFGSTFRVAVVVTSAGGTGLDGLQRKSSLEYWADRSLDATENRQAESRLDRMGGQQVVRVLFRDSMGYADRRWSREEMTRRRVDQSLRL